MTRTDAHAELDSLALRYTREEDEREAGLILERVLGACVPLIRDVVRSRLGKQAEMAQDIEDVCGGVAVDLIERLNAARSGAANLESLSRYAAVASYNACNDYFRSKFPERHRLRNRVRYLMKPERGFGLWESERGDWVCGLSCWQRSGTARAGRPLALPSEAARMPAPELLASIFALASGPAAFDELVDLLAGVWGVDVRTPVSMAAEDLPDPKTPALEEESGLRAKLETLWREIAELPRRQRVALLLNLKAPDERCALELFPLTGVASIRQLAALLEIPAADFAAMWSRLPLDDLTIGELLQISRQQVINLRKSARKRLERRMTEVIGDGNQRP